MDIDLKPLVEIIRSLGLSILKIDPQDFQHAVNKLEPRERNELENFIDLCEQVGF